MTNAPDLMTAYQVKWTPSESSGPRDKAGSIGFTDLRSAYEYLAATAADPIFDRDTLRVCLVNVPTWSDTKQIGEYEFGDDKDDKVIGVREPGKTFRFYKIVDQQQYRVVEREREATLPDRWKIETVADSDRSVGLTMIRGNQSHTLSVTPDEADQLVVDLLLRKLQDDGPQGLLQAHALLDLAIREYAASAR
jgi:hypothetical protein